MGPILGALLGGGGPIAKTIETVVDRLVPDKNLAEKVKSDIQKEMASAEIQMALAQLEINKIEAGSSSFWVSGWRPYIGWIGGTGFAVQFVIIPLVGYVYSLFGQAAPPPIELPAILWEVIFGILGIGIGSRTYEKVKGVAS